MGRLVAFYQTGRTEGTFEHGIELALRASTPQSATPFKDSPPAVAAPENAGPAVPPVDAKSVAVLAFANLSEIGRAHV